MQYLKELGQNIGLLTIATECSLAVEITDSLNITFSWIYQTAGFGTSTWYKKWGCSIPPSKTFFIIIFYIPSNCSHSRSCKNTSYYSGFFFYSVWLFKNNCHSTKYQQLLLIWFLTQLGTSPTQDVTTLDQVNKLQYVKTKCKGCTWNFSAGRSFSNIIHILIPDLLPLQNILSLQTSILMLSMNSKSYLLHFLWQSDIQKNNHTNSTWGEVTDVMSLTTKILH